MFDLVILVPQQSEKTPLIGKLQEAEVLFKQAVCYLTLVDTQNIFYF